MSQQAIFEYQVLEYALSNASNYASVGIDANALEEALPFDCAQEISRQIVEVLDDSSFTEVVTRLPNQPPPASPSNYGLRLWTQRKDGQTTSVTFYRINDSWQSTALSLVSLGIALATKSHPGFIAPSAGILLNSWKQLVSLKEKDRLEIDTYEALIRAMAKLATKTLSAKEPSPGEIFESRGECAVLATITDVTDGLKRLKELSLVEVTLWGGNAGDYSQKDNRWRPTI